MEVESELFKKAKKIEIWGYRIVPFSPVEYLFQLLSKADVLVI